MAGKEKGGSKETPLIGDGDLAGLYSQLDAINQEAARKGTMLTKQSLNFESEIIESGDEADPGNAILTAAIDTANVVDEAATSAGASAQLASTLAADAEGAQMAAEQGLQQTEQAASAAEAFAQSAMALASEKKKESMSAAKGAAQNAASAADAAVNCAHQTATAAQAAASSAAASANAASYSIGCADVAGKAASDVLGLISQISTTYDKAAAIGSAANGSATGANQAAGAAATLAQMASQRAGIAAGIAAASGAAAQKAIAAAQRAASATGGKYTPPQMPQIPESPEQPDPNAQAQNPAAAQQPRLPGMENENSPAAQDGQQPDQAGAQQPQDGQAAKPGDTFQCASCKKSIPDGTQIGQLCPTCHKNQQQPQSSGDGYNYDQSALEDAMQNRDDQPLLPGMEGGEGGDNEDHEGNEYTNPTGRRNNEDEEDEGEESDTESKTEDDDEEHGQGTGGRRGTPGSKKWRRRGPWTIDELKRFANHIRNSKNPAIKLLTTDPKVKLALKTIDAALATIQYIPLGGLICTVFLNWNPQAKTALFAAEKMVMVIEAPLQPG